MAEKNENQTNQKDKDVSSSFPLYMMCVLAVLTIGIIGSGIYTNCGRKKEYKNIVTKVEKDKMLVRDIDTDTSERILIGLGYHNPDDYEYLVSGDTIIVKADKDLYKNHKVLYYPTIQYNRGITLARQQRAKFNQIKDSVFVKVQQNKR
jgi:hypothetical protein